jgi:RimJ/RimL family protein N-acetyltransferase
VTEVVITEPIRTARLTLRPFTAADEKDMLAFESRADVARYLYNEPRTPEDNARELANRVQQTALRKEGDSLVLAIDLHSTVIGYVLLVWLSEHHRQGEFGYVLHPDHGGRG